MFPSLVHRRACPHCSIFRSRHGDGRSLAVEQYAAWAAKAIADKDVVEGGEDVADADMAALFEDDEAFP